eukprot:GHVN01089923.1.p1 GENE.GHVN01089923.1~~GHVN01089923.1.p1  ORF type:complete len:879 (-),score=165.44 GHVN01089923.1:184-2820(-)
MARSLGGRGMDDRDGPSSRSPHPSMMGGPLHQRAASANINPAPTCEEVPQYFKKQTGDHQHAWQQGRSVDPERPHAAHRTHLDYEDIHGMVELDDDEKEFQFPEELADPCHKAHRAAGNEMLQSRPETPSAQCSQPPSQTFKWSSPEPRPGSVHPAPPVPLTATSTSSTVSGPPSYPNDQKHLEHEDTELRYSHHTGSTNTASAKLLQPNKLTQSTSQRPSSSGAHNRYDDAASHGGSYLTAPQHLKRPHSSPNPQDSFDGLAVSRENVIGADQTKPTESSSHQSCRPSLGTHHSGNAGSRVTNNWGCEHLYHKEMKFVLRLEDPIAIQFLCSYNYSTSDEWKMDTWRRVVETTARLLFGDFLVKPGEVADAINDLFMGPRNDSGTGAPRSLVVVTPACVGDVTRGLLNKHHLLSESACLQHAHTNPPTGAGGASLWATTTLKRETGIKWWGTGAGETSANKLVKRRREKIVAPQRSWIEVLSMGLITDSSGTRTAEHIASYLSNEGRSGVSEKRGRDKQSAGMGGYLLTAISGGGGKPTNAGCLCVVDELEVPKGFDGLDGAQPSKVPVGEAANVVVVQLLEELSSQFLSAVRRSMNTPHVDGRESITSSPTQFDKDTRRGEPNMQFRNLLPFESRESEEVVIGVDAITVFLSAYVKRPITPAHIEIFVWYLSHYTGVVRPFCCPLNELSRSTEADGCEADGIRALKIGLRGDMGDMRGTSVPGRNVDVVDKDRAAVLEDFAERHLTRRIGDLSEKSRELKKRVESALAANNRQVALQWLKKRKVIDGEIVKVENQLFKIDEARQMRDSSSAIIAVSHVLHTSVKTTKSIMQQGTDVMDIMDEYQDVMGEMKGVHQAFADSASLSTGVEASVSCMFH